MEAEVIARDLQAATLREEAQKLLDKARREDINVLHVGLQEDSLRDLVSISLS